MSHQCLADAFAPANARYHADMQKYTWGHLAPKKNKKYRGFILFANSAYDGAVLLDSEFTSLSDSPWFYDAVIDFMNNQVMEPGCIYRFDGTFRNYEFDGVVKKISTE